MDFNQFWSKRKAFYMNYGLWIPSDLPFYYTDIDDNVLLSVAALASLFHRDVKTVRKWFNPGMKHGRLRSLSPTRFECTGLWLKEFWWERDKDSMLSQKVNGYTVMDWLINEK